MKNSLKWLGIIALMAVIVFAMSTCGDLASLISGEPTVTGVTVSPVSISVAKGGTQTFTATVNGLNNPDQNVSWSIIEDAKHSQTSINAAGVLTIAAEEALTALTVKAVSTADGAKFGTATVTVTGGSDPGTDPNTGGNTEGTFGDFTYTETTTITIIGYKGTGGAITIPAQIDGKPVTAIGDSAFKSNNLTSVIIPNSVTTIGDSAFQSNQLKSIAIPNSVTEIGEFAFSDNRLTSVTLGNSVTTIGNYAFRGDVMGGQEDNQITSIIIPDSVKTIQVGVFANNKLASVTIGNGVTAIWSSAFADNQLKSVSIPNSVTSIGSSAFSSNPLTSVIIGNGVTSIDSWAFINEYYVPDQLTRVTIGANVTLGYIVQTRYIPSFLGGFDDVYNNGKQAGTYTRPDTDSTVWTKQP